MGKKLRTYINISTFTSIYITMSVYLNLRSSESKDIFSANHGGNFKNELNEPIRLNGSWEVGLAEMTYHAQAFPNLPKEYSTVEVALKESLQVYNTMDKDFHVKTWVMWKGKWQVSDYHEIEVEKTFPHISRLPKKNYDWQDFKDAMSNITKQIGEGKSKPITNLSFSFKEDKYSVTFDSTARTAINYSYDLREFLSLKKVEIWQSPDINYFTEENTCTKPILPIDKFIIWPSDVEEDLWVQVNGYRFLLDRSNNTIAFFSSFIESFTSLQAEMYAMVRFKLSYTETDRAYEYDLSLSYCNPHCNNHNVIDIKWSPLLKRMLGLTDQRLDFTHTGKASIYTSIQKGTIPKLSPFIKTLPITDNLGYNFFPSAESLIDSLNALIAKSSSILNSKPIDKPAFSLNENEVCTFTEHPKFNITISSYLMKRLRLKNTDTTNTGTSLFIMPTATREFFYVRTDIINC